MNTAAQPAVPAPWTVADLQPLPHVQKTISQLRHKRRNWQRWAAKRLACLEYRLTHAPQPWDAPMPPERFERCQQRAAELRAALSVAEGWERAGATAQNKGG
jgi:hypothetical protein